MNTINLGTIVIDPGHGGTRNVAGSSANNAVSVSGKPEKAITLEVALLLEAALRDQATAAGERIKVILTRRTDLNVTGARRAGTAARHKATAFLSLHCNGSAKAAVRGPETFYRAAENGNANLASDKAFARAVHAGLVAGLEQAGLKGKDRGVKPDTRTALGALGVLNDARLGPGCRAALVEIEFITNKEVDRALVSGPRAGANMKTLTAALARALRGTLRKGATL